MSKIWNWTNFINVSLLEEALTTTEIADAILEAAASLISWHDYKGRLVVSISGCGGRFVSYWQLPTAIDMLLKTIKNCRDWKTWQQLRRGVKKSLKRCKYITGVKKKVERALDRKQLYFDKMGESLAAAVAKLTPPREVKKAGRSGRTSSKGAKRTSKIQT